MLAVVSSGCAYTAMDAYRHDNELLLRNESSVRATAHVTYSGHQKVTGVEPGDQRMIFYEKATESDRCASVRVTSPKNPDAEIKVPMELSEPRLFSLWKRHHLRYTSSGLLISAQD